MQTSLGFILAAGLLAPDYSVAGETAPKPQKFNSGGVSIQYTVEGQGEPVILIHGLSSSGQINWRVPGTTKILARDYLE